MAPHYFSNLQIADTLRNVAAALQLESEDQNRFRIIAYNRAADAIEHASSDIKDLWDNHELSSVAGIGESITSCLDELFKKGRVSHFSQILRKYPPAFYQFLKIPNIGPKTAIKLCKSLGITKKAGWLAKLQKAAQRHRVPKHLEKSISSFSDTPKRLLLHQATLISENILNYLKNCPQVLKCEVLGSLRRQQATIGDLDFAVSTHIPTSVIDYFCNYPKINQVLDAGNTKASIQLQDGLRVDLITCEPESFGTLLQHLTGSKHHNIALREYALSLGYSLSEHGLKNSSTQAIQKFATEKSLYNFLKLDYVAPEIREDHGEISAAKSAKLPQLVELSDLKGDLHLHTSFDTQTNHDLGQHPLSMFVDKAKSLGYAYIGITEHNPSQRNHSDGEINSIIKQKAEMVNLYNLEHPDRPHVFNGLEVDIKADGSLQIPDKSLAYLDYIIVAVHTSFSQNKRITTDRIIRGLSHPKAKVLAHPTARILQEREGINIDWDRLFEFCKNQQKILEIDSWPNRLDLPDFLVSEAVKQGVKIIISTDSHSLDQMEYIRYGVSVARRGWAQKSDILNTLDLNQIKEVIHK